MVTVFNDADLERVRRFLLALDPGGLRLARTIRRTFDQIYDGRNTGRYRWQDLRKTEKTHFGSLVEINLQREFRFEDGQRTDFRIDGVEVDCKWSQSFGGWMLPPEAVNEVCLLLTGSDEDSVWSAGLVRVSEELLNLGSNRDAKRTLNPEGRSAISWLWKDNPLPANVLLHIDPAIVRVVMEDLAGPRKGQRRLDELFRRVLCRPIGRGVVATVAQQDDYMKRVRANGGSRGNLKPEGIVIFGDYRGHREMAVSLGLPSLEDGDSMSAKLVRIPSPAERSIQLEGHWFRLCGVGEEPTKPAPDLPHDSRT